MDKKLSPVKWFADNVRESAKDTYDVAMSLMRENREFPNVDDVIKTIGQLKEEQIATLVREGYLPVAAHCNMHILDPDAYTVLVERVHKETKFSLKIKGASLCIFIAPLVR